MDISTFRGTFSVFYVYGVGFSKDFHSYSFSHVGLLGITLHSENGCFETTKNFEPVATKFLSSQGNSLCVNDTNFFRSKITF